jgi:mannose-1-phosphate guanylyltransferase/mannose-6-phosphate isomerase
MERCPCSTLPLKVVLLFACWSNRGLWDAVGNVISIDCEGHAYFRDALTTDCRNTRVYASSHIVSLVRVDTLGVVETANVVLAGDRSRSQGVKRILEQWYSEGRGEHVLHRKVHRPWGWDDGVDGRSCFNVKRIWVKPKADMSLPKYHYCAGQWVVITGTAEIACGNTTVRLSETQLTFILLGEVHRRTSSDTIPLKII